MIENLLKQTDIPDSHIANWGCKFMTLGAMVQNQKGQRLTAAEIMMVFHNCIYDGYINDNNLPVDGSKGDWFRAWILNSGKVIQEFARFMNVKLSIEKKYQKSMKNPITIPSDCNYCEIEYITKWGSHFGLGNYYPDLGIVDLYNPDPNIKILGTANLTYWSVTNV